MKKLLLLLLAVFLLAGCDPFTTWHDVTVTATIQNQTIYDIDASFNSWTPTETVLAGATSPSLIFTGRVSTELDRMLWPINISEHIPGPVNPCSDLHNVENGNNYLVKVDYDSINNAFVLQWTLN
jgi:hypothetical protein